MVLYCLKTSELLLLLPFFYVISSWLCDAKHFLLLFCQAVKTAKVLQGVSNVSFFFSFFIFIYFFHLYLFFSFLFIFFIFIYFFHFYLVFSFLFIFFIFI